MRLLHRATDVSIRKYAEICVKLQKIYGDLQQNTETRRIPVGQISYSSIGGVSLFNGIAQYGNSENLPWDNPINGESIGIAQHAFLVIVTDVGIDQN